MKPTRVAPPPPPVDRDRKPAPPPKTAAGTEQRQPPGRHSKGADFGEDPYPSLSDFHDYEPNLEFDDSELHHAARPEALDIEEETLSANGYVETPVSDITIEENFEAELGQLTSLTWNGVNGNAVIQRLPISQSPEDFSDIAKYGIVEVVGDDVYGRKVIVVSACKLPSNKILDHGRFLRYLMHTLDQYVEEDYSLVYFHYGLNSKNKPPLTWLWQAYRAFDRKYKKNLKALYLVHPTNFIKLIWQIFRPAISVKFGRKMMYVNRLQELRQYIHLEQVAIPQGVLDHDRRLSSRSTFYTVNRSPSVSRTANQGLQPLDTQQFGVDLNFIKAKNNGDPVAPILRNCIVYLSFPDRLETEGLFRRSGSAALVTELISKINAGEEVDFGSPHVAAVILKKHLRELSEPLMTFDVFDEIVAFEGIPREERSTYARNIILEKLPEDNYHVLRNLVSFLQKVMDRSDLNKMTSSNLAVVFGPNMVWSRGQELSLASISPINLFFDHVFSHADEIFLR